MPVGSETKRERFVLLVNGSPQTEELVRDATARCGGLAAEGATSVGFDEAVRHLQSGLFAVAFIDLTHSSLQGPGLRALSEVDSAVPLVAFIAPHDEPAALAALGAGVAEVVELDPPDPAELIRVISRASARTEAALQRTRQLRRVFDTVASGIVVSDSHGTVVEMNPAARRWLRVSDESPAFGMSLSSLTPMFGEVGPRQEAEIVDRDGNNLTIGFSTTETATGGHRVTVLRDLTDIRAEERRRRRAEQLARVGESAARLSHELKNPLASVVAGLQLLERVKSLSPAHRSILESTLGEARRLSATIGALLESSRDEPVQLRRLNAGNAIGRAVQPYLPLAEERGLRLCLDVGEATDCELMADEAALRRVIANLIVNAVEASPTGGTISVAAHMLPAAERLRRFPGFGVEILQVLVSDEGQGVPDGILRDVFRPFFTTKEQGTGIGLATSRELTELHGGSLQVRPSSARGATFEILLPAGVPQPCWTTIRGPRRAACDDKKPGPGYPCWLAQDANGTAPQCCGRRDARDACPLVKARRLPGADGDSNDRGGTRC